MRRMKSKCKMLFSCMLSLLLCVSMLLGDVTIAAATDTDSSTESISVTLYKYNGTEYVDVSDNIDSGSIQEDKSIWDDAILWYPGKTEVVFLKVQNNSNVAVNYDVLLNATASTLASGANTADAFCYAMLTDMTAETFATASLDTWDKILQQADKTDGLFLDGASQVVRTGSLDASGSDIFAFVIHMNEEAGSEYMNGSITFDMEVGASKVVEGEVSEYDILEGNGDFEEGVTFDNTSGGKSGTWNHLAAGSYGSVVELREGSDAKFGSRYLYMAERTVDGTTIQPRVMYMNQPYIIEGGKTYTLEFWFKRLNDTCDPYISIQDRKGKNEILDVIEVYCVAEGGTETNTWIKVTKEFTTNVGSDRMRLSIRCAEDSEFCIDGIKVLGQPSELDLAKKAWEEKLAAEVVVSKMLPSDNGFTNVWKEKLEGTPDNLLTNGDFTSDVTGWKGNNDTEGAKSYSWSENGRGGVGDGCLLIDDKLYQVKPKKAPAIGQKVYDIVGGAEYQVSLWYKITDSKNVSCDPFVDIECFADTNEPGDDGYLGGLETRLVETEIIRDGQWHQYVFRGYVPLRTDYVSVFARKLQGEGEVYIDDIVFTMTDTSNPISLNSNMKIFYRDMKTTQFEATVKTDYYTEYVDGTVVFEVYDGQTKVWESARVALADSKATVDFELSKLEKLDTPYCVMATLYDGDTAVEAASKNIYVYNRPSAINENGEYVKFNTEDETFTPVFGYHVYQNADVEHYDEVAAAGINVVQLPNGLTADEVYAHLEILNDLGIKGMVCLYNGNMPAGDESNVTKTIAKVSDERIRNHPAMFGYNIADEPFIHQMDPRQDLEDSYRLIRQYDENNVIMCVEDLEYMIPETTAYVDAVILDPYFGAAGATVYGIVEEALEVVNFNKPAWIVLSTYIHQNDGYFNTADDVRNNNYQALLAGISGVGYFSISDPGNLYSEYLIKMDPKWEGLVYAKTEGYIPVWDVKTPTNANAGAEVWEAITTFDTVELPIVGEYFVGNKGTKISEEINIDAGYMYHSWTTEDGKDYLVVLNVKGDDVHVDIPVSGVSAKILAGRAEDTKLYGIKDGKLNLDLVNVEALLLELTDTPIPESVEIVADKTDESYTIGSNGEVTIYCTGDLDEFVKVEVDGTEVDKSNYTLEEGSTILNFKASYLDTLDSGDHTLKLVYTGERSVVTTLTVKEKTVSENDTTIDNETEGEEADDTIDNSVVVQDNAGSVTPTGDSNHLVLWIILAFTAFIGAIIYGMIYRKKNNI